MPGNYLWQAITAKISDAVATNKEVWLAKYLTYNSGGATLNSLKLDLSRFDAAPLSAFIATEETNYGTEADGRIPQGCGAHSTDRWADA